MERSDFNEETSCHFLFSDLVKKKKPHWIDVKKIKEGRKIPLKISELAMGHVKMNSANGSRNVSNANLTEIQELR